MIQFDSQDGKFDLNELDVDSLLFIRVFKFFTAYSEIENIEYDSKTWNS